ncbi:MAG: peptide deformylase [Immundisolibacteraceae bacterium]|nr:peptide deformylase [Immundisolibacteraceae bacterium]
MAIREILRMGDRRLQQIAQPVSVVPAAAIDDLLIDMFDTMADADGVGLAAPQIGESLRIVIFGFDQNNRYPDELAVPKTVLINPRIEVIDGAEELDWEGCLSVPGMRGLVPRSRAIRYQGVDQTGATIDRMVSGFHARVVLHECDHLDGVLYPQRIRDLRDFGFEELMGD